MAISLSTCKIKKAVVRLIELLSPWTEDVGSLPVVTIAISEISHNILFSWKAFSVNRNCYCLTTLLKDFSSG